MAKFDIRNNPAAADRLLAKLENPRHRRIVSNYRRHSLSEVAGLWEQIFGPGMMADEPIYHMAFADVGGRWLDRQGIRDFYAMLVQERLNVIGIRSSRITVGDESMTTDSEYLHFMTGEQAIRMGATGIDPRGYYRAESHTVGVWYFDEQARLLGEHGGVVGQTTFVEIPEEEFITPEEAMVALVPLINDLEPYAPGDEHLWLRGKAA